MLLERSREALRKSLEVEVERLPYIECENTLFEKIRALATSYSDENGYGIHHDILGMLVDRAIETGEPVQELVTEYVYDYE